LRTYTPQISEFSLLAKSHRNDQDMQHHYRKLCWYSPNVIGTPIITVIQRSLRHVFQCRANAIVSFGLFTSAFVSNDGHSEEEEQSQGDGRSNTRPDIVCCIEFLGEKYPNEITNGNIEPDTISFNQSNGIWTKCKLILLDLFLQQNRIGTF